MRVTIAGIGHGGTAMAADLSIKGHDVTLLKTSANLHNSHYRHLLENSVVTLEEDGQSREVPIADVTDDFAAALSGADVIVVFVQTNYHEALLARIRPFLTGRELILLEPGYLSTAYLVGGSSGSPSAVAEATSSPIDCRIVEPGTVRVSFRNVANQAGIFPRSRRTWAEEVLNELDYNWVFFESPIEAALHNPNLIVHTVGAIMSFPRIEFSGGNYWMYKEVFTPTVWNIVEALDHEKMAVLSSLGFRPIEYVEACKQRNSQDPTKDAKEVFFDYARNSSVSGPSVVNSRYVTEDVPEGLVLLESLGEITAVETPVCTSLIELASAALRTDFRSIGRNIDRLGRSSLDILLKDVSEI